MQSPDDRPSAASSRQMVAQSRAGDQHRFFAAQRPGPTGCCATQMRGLRVDNSRTTCSVTPMGACWRTETRRRGAGGAWGGVLTASARSTATSGALHRQTANRACWRPEAGGLRQRMARPKARRLGAGLTPADASTRICAGAGPDRNLPVLIRADRRHSRGFSPQGFQAGASIVLNRAQLRGDSQLDRGEPTTLADPFTGT